MAKYGYRFQAEWEPQSGIMVMWPHKDTDWKPYLEDITETYIQLADAITKYEALLIVTQNEAEVKTLLSQRLTPEQLNSIVFKTLPINDTWARDVAPISLIATEDGKDIEAQHHLLDFTFNGWGKKFASDKDNEVNRKLYHTSTFHGVLENHKDFVLEGGAIETDGVSTLFTTSLCLLAPNRNQPLTKADIELRLLALFPNCERVVWIDYGQLEGDDTDGHIDTILRCAPNNTLLYIGTEDESDSHYAELKALEKQVTSLKTIDNKPYTCYKLPIPKPIYNDGERLPATYANYLVINGAVIVPTYDQPTYDNIALEVLQKAFPNHDIIGIDANTIIKQHGSIHCITMQFPEGVLKQNPCNK